MGSPLFFFSKGEKRMSKFRIRPMANRIRTSLVKHSPEILTGIGIAGMITTVVLAVKETPKALQLIEELKQEKETASISHTDVVKATWKCYIPSAVTGTLSVACLICASSVHLRRNAALAAAYTLSDTALREYREKVIETIGTDKEKEVREKVSKHRLEKHPMTDKDVAIIGREECLVFEHLSGRYFSSNMEKLKAAENELNKELINDMYVSLNDFYDELDLEHTRIGYDLGWRVEDGAIKLEYHSQLTSDGRPCIVIEYERAPKYDYECCM